MLIKAEIIVLTPSKAEELLKTVKMNRNISASTVECYASDMKAGRWYDNCVPITLDSEGNLIDGQHRCAAVIKSGCMIPCVLHYISDNSAKGFDLNRVRSTKDTLRLEGIENKSFRVHGIIGAVTLALSITNSNGSHNRRPSKFECIEKMYDHKEAIDFAYSMMPTTIAGITKSSVYAAIISAYESGYDREKLERFVEVLKTGFMKRKDEESIIRLRDVLMRNKSSSASITRDMCYTVMNVMWNYERGNVLTKIYISTSPKYPMF